MKRLPVLLALLLAGSAHAATFTVTSTADTDGSSCGASCTLRQAINAANATANQDTIEFQLPGTDLQRIELSSNLPTITQPVQIDGYSQPGALVNTLADGASNAVIRVWLDADPNGGTEITGLAVCASGVRIQGLAITGFLQRNLAVGLSAGGAQCSGVSGVVIAGNFLGLDPLGRAITGSFSQISIQAANVRVGGTSVDRNVISGRAPVALELVNNASLELDGNLFGLDPTGSQARGSGGTGVAVAGGASATIGGTSRNCIDNLGIGVLVTESGRATVLANRFAGTGMPIDLGADGVTPNDPGDGDSGPNNLLNFPVLSSATRRHDGLAIIGAFDRPGAGTYTFHVYSSRSCAAAGHGPGARLLGSFTRSFTTVTPNLIATTLGGFETPFLGHVITMTATDAAGNTSEFSPCEPVAEDPAALLVTSTATTGAGTLRSAIEQANATPGADIIAFAIPGAGPHAIATSGFPVITQPLTVDGYSQPGASPNTLASGASNASIRIQISANGMAPGFAAFRATAPLTLRGVAIREPPDGTAAVAMSAGSRVQGCFIGLDATGAAAGSASGDGVVTSESSEVGGPQPAHRNVFGGLSRAIVRITPGSLESMVQGNLIGTAPDGIGARPNTCPVSVNAINADIRNLQLGGHLPHEQNLIAHSTGNCPAISVLESGALARGVRIGNASFGNNGIGIDLAGNGVSGNDPDDGDAGPNGLQNFPLLQLAQARAEGGIAVRGTLDIPSESDGRYTLAFYESAGCDASGHGEGTIYLGSQDVRLVQLGGSPPFVREHFLARLPGNPPPGSAITATATAPDGSTSEFSRCTPLLDSNLLQRDGFE